LHPSMAAEVPECWAASAPQAACSRPRGGRPPVDHKAKAENAGSGESLR
jgi:hypothetical protein